MKRIENSYLNSVRWYALCDAITTLDKYNHGVSSMQFYLPISGLCEAVANGLEQVYENTEEQGLGL
ncbi:MAG: hypothetical protein J6Q15_00255 [Clostridia bacterium]|nr:hypothetical protein [Clostridia bacterium]